MNNRVKGVLYLTLLGLAIAVTLFYNSRPKPRPIEIIVQEEVTKHIKKFKRIKHSKCTKDILEEADKIVDSLLINYAIQHSKMKSLRKPDKKLRPGLPRLDLPDSFLAALPLIHPDSIYILDSLLHPEELNADSVRISDSIQTRH